MAAAAAAQTTGGLVGRVTDEDGGALPGVAVEAKSDALQGTRVAQTDPSGAFRIALLPPGTYTVVFTLEGFAADTRQVEVNLGRDTTLNTALRAAAAEEITVYGETPVIDPTSTALGVNLEHARHRDPAHRAQLLLGRPGRPRRLLGRQPGEQRAVDDHRLRLLGRREQLLHRRRQHHRRRVRLPGQGAQLRVHPGDRRQDRRLRGRVRPLDRRRHQRDHQVRAATSSTATSSATGTTTRSSPPPIRSSRPAATVEGFTREDYGADLGGYLVKDKLWFFAAYDRVDHTTDTTLLGGPAGGTGRRVRRASATSAAAKLTWNVGAAPVARRHLLPGPARRRRRDQRRRIDHGLNGAAARPTSAGRSFGGRDYALRYDGSRRPSSG